MSHVHVLTNDIAWKLLGWSFHYWHESGAPYGVHRVVGPVCVLGECAGQ